MTPEQPVLLCILDGWGIGLNTQNNGILKAQHWSNMLNAYPWTALQASEEFIGLPAHQMGNSEVGHMTLGLGRVFWQDLPRIDQAIQTKELEVHEKVVHLIRTLKANGKACHILGLMSPGGVHSHQNHIIYCANLLAQQGIPVWIHGFLDGRDTPPTSARSYVAECQQAFHHLVQFATLGGRYFGMDRDQRWDRVEKAYNAMIDAKGHSFSCVLNGIEHFYNQGIYDEFIPPFCLQGFSGMRDGDALWMINFRSDRVRQILHSLLDPDFSNFHQEKRVIFSKTLGMGSYSKELDAWMPYLFDKMPTTNSLGQVISQANLGQLRIAETEKYAHVTFFFNGGWESPFPLEDRILVPSPKVSTYDLQPEMSAKEVTDHVLAAMTEKKHALIVLNYANTDMVGHTGVVTAIEKAVETVDGCLRQLEKQAKEKGWVMLVTADHGNAEQMVDGHAPHTAHTCNPVPFMVVNGGAVVLKNGGTLANVAPTILKFLGIPKPVEMTAEPLCDIIP
jgi:2,3-bisphosphoglycerate-independent phosphoglycerate mutase